MKFLPLTLLALFTFLCTCASAQSVIDKLPRDVSSVAFIKGNTGFLIDSIAISTSLDSLPYGFPFPGDTLLLDISIFRPVDELTVRTFSSGHSFEHSYCWIDAPSADVYLSIDAGRTVIDSVSLSPTDRWFRRKVIELKLTGDLQAAKLHLQNSIFESYDLLLCAAFIEAYQALPNLSREDIFWLRRTVQEDIGPVKRHPRFTPLLNRLKLLRSNLPGKLDKYDLRDFQGKAAELPSHKGQYYVLNLYDARKAACRRDHQLLQEMMASDSILTGTPIISVTQGDYVTAWHNYVSNGNFSWPHYREVASPTKPGLHEKMALYPASTYVLLNEQNKIVGVFDTLDKVLTSLLVRRQTKR